MKASEFINDKDVDEGWKNVAAATAMAASAIGANAQSIEPNIQAASDRSFAELDAAEKRPSTRIASKVLARSVPSRDEREEMEQGLRNAEAAGKQNSAAYYRWHLENPGRNKDVDYYFQHKDDRKYAQK